MPAVPCPACNETVRLPDTQLPPEGTIQCPWCRDSRSVEEWTSGLPPLAFVFGPDGLPFEADPNVADPNPVQQTAEDLNHSVSSDPESCKTPDKEDGDDEHIEDAFAALESTGLSGSDWQVPLDSDLIVDQKQRGKIESGLLVAENRLLASKSNEQWDDSGSAERVKHKVPVAYHRVLKEKDYRSKSWAVRLSGLFPLAAAIAIIGGIWLYQYNTDFGLIKSLLRYPEKPSVAMFDGNGEAPGDGDSDEDSGREGFGSRPISSADDRDAENEEPSDSIAYKPPVHGGTVADASSTENSDSEFRMPTAENEEEITPDDIADIGVNGIDGNPEMPPSTFGLSSEELENRKKLQEPDADTGETTQVDEVIAAKEAEALKNSLLVFSPQLQDDLKTTEEMAAPDKIAPDKAAFADAHVNDQESEQPKLNHPVGSDITTQDSFIGDSAPAEPVIQASLESPEIDAACRLVSRSIEELKQARLEVGANPGRADADRISLLELECYRDVATLGELDLPDEGQNVTDILHQISGLDSRSSMQQYTTAWVTWAKRRTSGILLIGKLSESGFRLSDGTVFPLTKDSNLSHPTDSEIIAIGRIQSDAPSSPIRILTSVVAP